MNRDDDEVQARTRLLLAHCREHHLPMTGDHRVSSESAAKLIGVHEDTLRKWRVDAQGPSYYRLGGSISYAVEDLARYVLTNRYAASLPRGH